MFDVYHYGALRVLVDQVTGAAFSVQDRISGLAASLRYSRAYIASAIRYACMAHESRYTEA